MKLASDGSPVVALLQADEVLAARTTRFLDKAGAKVVQARSAAEARLRLAEAIPDCWLVSLASGPEAIDLVRELRTRDERLPVLLLVQGAQADLVASVLEAGGDDYLDDPVDELRLVVAVRNALKTRRLAIEVATLERESGTGAYPGIAGRSAPMRRLFAQLDRIAPSDITVLIHGESGTGKELIARAIHVQSGRRGPFIALNCAAIPETLQESELFGHEKGAFTGAVARSVGKFEQAHRGTLFLDEVAELSAAAQAKLLRVLQERTFQRVGGTELVSVDIRLVAATHRDLAAEVKAGRFREDLYYRLAVMELSVPPLREREGDVVLLAHQFLAQADAGRNHDRSFGLDALEAMVTYDWPGNVRELENAVERAAVLASGEWVTLADLPDRIRAAVLGGAAPAAVPASAAAPAVSHAGGLVLAGLTLDALERLAIEEAFRRTGGNISQMSRELGIGRTALYRKLKQYAGGLGAEDA
ncbi:MAG TPA: sigma-54 dependent transcriptional regulator [Gemmatimonadales bacterium]